jgi:23S rRNA (guanosine2251-2'-O)-methyltransferase
LVLGVQPVREALLAHKAAVTEVLLLRDSPRLMGIEKLARDLGVNVASVSRQELDRLCRGAQHQGAIARAPELALRSLAQLLDTDTLLIALDGIVDPQNFGAVIRSAVGVADAAVLWARNKSAPLSWATFRASAGAVEHARLCLVDSLAGALTEASSAGFQIVGLDGHAEAALHQMDLRGPTVIVVGSEGGGLNKSVRRSCTQLARLATSNRIDSLNASVAAAIATYEAARQRA